MIASGAAYAKATRRHVTAIREQEAAADKGDLVAMRSLESLIVYLGRISGKRELSRQVVRARELAAHAEKKAATQN